MSCMCSWWNFRFELFSPPQPSPMWCVGVVAGAAGTCAHNLSSSACNQHEMIAWENHWAARQRRWVFFRIKHQLSEPIMNWNGWLRWSSLLFRMKRVETLSRQDMKIEGEDFRGEVDAISEFPSSTFNLTISLLPPSYSIKSVSRKQSMAYLVESINFSPLHVLSA